MADPTEPPSYEDWARNLFGGTRPKVEPTAAQRELAKNIVGMFVALRDEGMTDRQACTLLGTWFGTTPPTTEGDT